MKIKCKYGVWVLFFITSSVLMWTSCAGNRYVVYTANMQKIPLQLKDTSQAVILVDIVSCKPCLPDLISQFSSPSQKVIIIGISAKNINAVQAEKKTLWKYVKDNPQVQIYFQFSKKNNIYSYAPTNKIFRRFVHGKSPSVILWNKKTGYQTIEPPFDP